MRHVGEPVAMVVAESVAIAKDALDLVDVDSAPLPAVVDAARLRCFADGGHRGTDYEILKTELKKRYPPDRPGEDYTTNDVLAIGGGDNRMCKIARVAFCPLGEHRMRDVMRRVRGFDEVVAPVDLRGFPPEHDVRPAPDGYPDHLGASAPRR